MSFLSAYNFKFYLFFRTNQKFGPFHCSVVFCFMDMSYVVYLLSLLMNIYIVSIVLAITIKLYEYFFASVNVDMSLVFLGKYLSQ